MIWAVIKLSGDTIHPLDYELKEYWTWKPVGEKPWIFRVFTKGRFWEDHRGLKNNPGFPLSEGDDAGSSHRRESPLEEEKFDPRAPSPHPFNRM
jgi:adenine/guanine/hypoxanthine permease